MLKIERHNYIENQINLHGSVLISDLSNALSCHEETIRRDLREMEAAGRLKRIHGGAYIPSPEDTSVPTNLRNSLFFEEKQTMARAALSLITPQMTIMLDSSTTCLRLAEAIVSANLPVTLITNSQRICSLLDSVRNSAVKLFCTGGLFRTTVSSFVGYAATAFLSTCYADLCFISPPGISRQFGLSDKNANEANVRLSMLQHSKKRILLIDHTKFRLTGNALFTSFDLIDQVITDERPGKEWEEYFSKNSITVQYASAES